MIRLIEKGAYSLTGTRHGARLLYLQKHTYAWIVAPRIGALLIHSTVAHARHEALSAGSYRLYKVANEPHSSDQMHLELEFGDGKWQGYLLPAGLPDRRHIRRRIIPTRETITHSETPHRVRSRGPLIIRSPRIHYGLSH